MTPQRTIKFPIGVVYSAPGNITQWDMWNNERGSAGFDAFCNFLGDRIRLQGWHGYAGGLDVKNNTKGTESIYTKWGGYEVMFHVSTLLPFNPMDERKLQRSRVIGNDITMIIYKEGKEPYMPNTITGGVSHVFLVVSPIEVNGRTKYRVGVCYKDYLNSFDPPLPDPAIFDADETLRNFLLVKLINGHIAAQASPGLKMMYNRPRLALLDEIAKKYWKDGPPASKKPAPARTGLLGFIKLSSS